MSDIFLNSAILVHDTGIPSCLAIMERVGYNFSTAAFLYRRVFTPTTRPQVQGWWMTKDTPANREARIYALLLAHEMHRSGDL